MLRQRLLYTRSLVTTKKHIAARVGDTPITMEEYLSHFEFLVVGGSLIGGWIKFQADYNRLASRVYTLETDNKEFKADVKKLLSEIQEIKLLLAKNKVE
jgi:outer membrane murein-binding lipoprotein Lpp